MKFPCKIWPIFLINRAIHIYFSSQRRGYSSLCFSQLRWLWRREISRDERREKLRIPFGIGRMKKSKKYPNGGKLSKVWQIVWLWKTPFSHNVLTRRSKVSRSSFFFFETPALPSRSMKYVVHASPNSSFGGPYQKAHTHSAPSPLARAKWIYDGNGNAISLQNVTNILNNTSVPHWFFFAAAWLQLPLIQSTSMTLAEGDKPRRKKRKTTNPIRYRKNEKI